MFIITGKLYGIPVCDWFNLSGFNKLTYEAFYGDIGTTLGDRYVHVTNDGYKRMAEILVPFLENN